MHESQYLVTRSSRKRTQRKGREGKYPQSKPIAFPRGPPRLHAAPIMHENRLSPRHIPVVVQSTELKGKILSF